MEITQVKCAELAKHGYLEQIFNLEYEVNALVLRNKLVQHTTKVNTCLESSPRIFS